MEQRHILPDRHPGTVTREAVLARLAQAVRPLSDCQGPDAANPQGGVPSAVLVPLVDRDGGFTILLTRRTEHLHNHGGQICFPGGRVDAGDTSPAATALRETAEEVGLPAEAIDVIGCLDPYLTVTGFLVTPVIGVVRPPFELTLDADEVAAVFELPLAFVLDPGNHQQLSPSRGGSSHTTYAMPYQGHYIWGATAAMLMNLYRILAATRP